MRNAITIAIVIAWAAPASAQATLELEVAARATIDTEALRDALARELDTEVTIATGRQGSLSRLRVRSAGARRASLELVRGDGSRMRRSTELPADADERLATIVILASNMVRDEASELLAMLRGRRATGAGASEGAAVEAPSTERAADEASLPAIAAGSTPADRVVAENVVAERAHAEEAERLEPGTDGAARPIEVGEPAAAAPTPPDDRAAVASADANVRSDATPAPEVARPSSAQPGQRVFRLGLGGLIGSVPRGTGTDATFVGGLELAWTPTDFLAFGVRDLGGGAPLGVNDRWSVGGALFGEIGWVVDPALVLHLEIGVDLRAMVSADVPAAGVAPLVLLGARYFPIRELSLSVQTAVHVTATDAWTSNLHVLPLGAVLWTGGFSIAVHVS